MGKVNVSFMKCPRCQQPHDRREACSTNRVGFTEKVNAGTIRNRARRRKGPRYQFTLSKAQRRQLFTGQSPRIAVPKGCSPFAPGDVYQLPGSTRIWLGITGIEEGKDEDVILYTLYDETPRLLRAAPHGVDFEAIRRSFDGRGRPSPLRDPEAVADAAEESAYTSSPGAALRVEGEAVSREEQERLTEESTAERRMRREQSIARIEVELEMLAANPDFSAEQSDVKYLRRKIQRWREEDATEQAAA